MTRRYIPEPRFHGGGLVVALVCAGCLIAGLLVGAAIASP